MEQGVVVQRTRSDHWGAWDRFLAGRPDSGFHQSSWWAALHRRSGEGAFGVMVRRNGIVHGGAVVVRVPSGEGQAFYHIVDGPVVPLDAGLAAEVMRSLLSAVQRRHAREPVVISHLRLEPRWRELPDFLRDLGPLVVGPPRRATMIDLGASETTLLSQMSRAARANVALARQLGLRVREDAGPVGMRDLHSLVARAAAVPTGADAPDTLRLLPLLQLPGRGGIFFAEDGKERLAVAAVVQFGARATLLMAAADSLLADAPAPALLQFEVMRRVKARHGLEYDLGDLSARLVALGGVAERRVGPIDIVFDPPTYERHRPAEQGSGGLSGG